MQLREREPHVSVVIPAYRVAQYIGETLESVFAQTYDNYEVILVNDGSPDTDKLERVLEPYFDRIIYIRQENRGAGAARNAGIRVARGRYIAFLDADDLWERDLLAVQMGILQSNPTIDVLYSDAVLFGDSPNAGKRYSDICPSEGEVTFESLLAERCTVILSGVVARKQSLVEVGLFDESMPYTEDFDLWLRIAKNNGRIAYHRRLLVRHRLREGSTSTSDPTWLYGNILSTLDRIERTMHLTPAEAETLKRRRAFNQAMLLYLKGKNAFSREEIKAAISYLGEANSFFRSWKLRLVLLFLRFAPELLLRAQRLRDRYIFSVNLES